MKNIHILPTDKPSRLWMTKLGNLTRCHDIKPVKEALGNNVNIYITNDEEIKTDNYISYPTLKTWISVKYLGGDLIGNEKKIILTTDQDLINDGVQAIDDEFLKWFVKNPSCEYVNFISYINEKSTKDYEIIIPKEEPKFENSIENTINLMSIANSMFSKKEKPKQETLEEAAENYINKFYTTYDFKGLLKNLFIDDVKYQQEQDKNKYSEKDLFDCWKASHTGGLSDESLRIHFKQWFEKFKKK